MEWSNSASPSPPHSKETSVAGFCCYPHHRLQWSLVTEGHSSLCSQVLLCNTLLGFPHPSLLAISSLSLAGHFLPLPLNQRGFFSHSSKELVTFTARYWNLWTEQSHSSAKLDWFQLPHSRKLLILQLSLFSCLNHPIFLRLGPQWQRSCMASETGGGSCQRLFPKPFKARGDFTMFPISKQSYSIWLLPAVSQYLSLTPVYYCSSGSRVKFPWLPGWSFLMQTWCNVPACPIPGYMTSPEPQQTTAPPRCATFSTTGLLVLCRLSDMLESITQSFTGIQNCPTDKQRNHTYTEISKGTVMLHKPVATAFNLPYIQNSSPPLLVHWSHTILYERAWCQTFRAAQHGLLIGMIQIGTADKLLFHAAVRGALKNGHVQIYATFVSLYWHYSVEPATGEALLCYENI